MFNRPLNPHTLPTLVYLICDQFVNARGNQRWNCFKSDKVAEISYASTFSESFT
jgi:hypothetical protein